MHCFVAFACVCAWLIWALHFMPNCLEFCQGDPWEHGTANTLDVVTCPLICADISVLGVGFLHWTPTDACAVVKKLCKRHASWTPPSPKRLGGPICLETSMYPT